jgi:hypothetical protein
MVYRRWVNATKRVRGTLMFTDKGVVTDVVIVRGDVNLQL